MDVVEVSAVVLQVLDGHPYKVGSDPKTADAIALALNQAMAVEQLKARSS